MSFETAAHDRGHPAPLRGSRVFAVVTNIPNLGRDLDSARIQQRDVIAIGTWRESLRIFAAGARADAVVLNIATAAVLMLCLFKWLLPWVKCTIISVDILLPRPVSLKQRAAAAVKKLLLKKVDLFVLYFKDLADYGRFYGISATRSSYVPFKSNSWERLPPAEELTSDGSYVLTAGRTMRDVQTFVEAMRLAEIPSVLMYLKHDRLIEHGTTMSIRTLPGNVKLLEHDGNRATWIERMMQARIVVVPILPETISSSGIGTSIDAMAMKKCVVVTEGQTSRGVLDDVAVVVPARDPAALAAAVRRYWFDDDARRELGSRGRRFAEGLAGERRLHRDIAAAMVNYLSSAGYRS